MAGLESHLSQLKDDLNKTKDQLAFSKSQKQRSIQEANEVKKSLRAALAKLRASVLHLQSITQADDECTNGVTKTEEEERDRSSQSELEAVRKQQSVEMFLSSEPAHTEQEEKKTTSELCDLKPKMAGIVSAVEDLNTQITEFEKSEAGYQELINLSHLQLEMANDTIYTLHCEHSKLTETLISVSKELEESKAQVTSLDAIIKKMKTDEKKPAFDGSQQPGGEDGETSEFISLHLERLRSALKTTEILYQEELIKSTFRTQNAHEAVESNKIDSGLKEARLELQLEEAKTEISELRLSLLDKETVIEGLGDLNQTQSELECKLKQMMGDISDLKTRLMDKENQIRKLVEENGLLRSEMEQKQAEWDHANELARTAVDSARAAEQEALAKVDNIMEAADKSAKEVVSLNGQIESAQAANSEKESELRRLKVQMQQWRKAAEVAMAILSSDDGAKAVERTGTFGLDHVSSGEKTMSPLTSLEDDESNSSRKKSNNMLKRFSIMMKKGQK